MNNTLLVINRYGNLPLTDTKMLIMTYADTDKIKGIYQYRYEENQFADTDMKKVKIPILQFFN